MVALLGIYIFNNNIQIVIVYYRIGGVPTGYRNPPVFTTRNAAAKVSAAGRLPGLSGVPITGSMSGIDNENDIVVVN